MSAPKVDVLAILSDAASDMPNSEAEDQLMEARAVVAELIEVVDELADWVDGVLPSLDGEEGGNSKLAAVRAALARIGGAP